MSDVILHTNRSILKETLYIAVMIFAVILFLGLIGMSGRAEIGLRSFFFGWFSYAAFIFPPIIIFLFRPLSSLKEAQPCMFKPVEGAIEHSDAPVDVFYDAAVGLAEQLGGIGIKSIRKRFSVGHSRAKKIMGEMDRQGLLSEQIDAVGRRLLHSAASL